jgi:GntR family transcriptional regulator
MEQITRLVRDGVLKPGDQLPSERELMAACGAARGTIKKACERLVANGVIEVIPGRGSFVSFRQDVVNEGRKETAVRLIRELLLRLEELKFSPRETGTLFDLMLMEREERRDNLFIAVVDCNPDCLEIYERQIGWTSRLQIAKFLLDDVLKAPDPAGKLAPFELIVTSATHYTEMLGVAPRFKDRIVPMILSPSQEAVMNLAQIRASQRIGIWCRSREFLDIIRRRLKEFNLPMTQLTHAVGETVPDMREFLKNVDVLILPPGGLPTQDKASAAAMQAFGDRGGRLIRFDYQVERGSLANLEERLRELIRKRPPSLA